MARLRVPRRRGRPRTRPDVVLADKAYSSRAIREHLRKRGIRAVVPAPRGPARTPAPSRKPRRQTTSLRPQDLQAAQHRRAVQQPPEAVARHRHPLREDRHHPPGRTPQRRHLPLVRPMIQTKPPSRNHSDWPQTLFCDLDRSASRGGTGPKALAAAEGRLRDRIREPEQGLAVSCRVCRGQCRFSSPGVRA